MGATSMGVRPQQGGYTTRQEMGSHSMVGVSLRQAGFA